MVPAIALAAVVATSIAPPAAQNLAEWLGPQNYPVIPLEFGLQGFTQADVYIDELGQPKACYVIVSSGVDQLDSQTCAAAMHRGKFTPAHDDAGVTMPGMYRFRVTLGPRSPVDAGGRRHSIRCQASRRRIVGDRPIALYRR